MAEFAKRPSETTFTSNSPTTGNRSSFTPSSQRTVPQRTPLTRARKALSSLGSLSVVQESDLESSICLQPSSSQAYETDNTEDHFIWPSESKSTTHMLRSCKLPSSYTKHDKYGKNVSVQVLQLFIFMCV